MLTAFDKGALKSVATHAERTQFTVAARVTALKHKPVNIRRPSGVLQKHWHEFLQRLEGEHDEVEAVYATICHVRRDGFLCSP